MTNTDKGSYESWAPCTVVGTVVLWSEKNDGDSLTLSYHLLSFYHISATLVFYSANEDGSENDDLFACWRHRWTLSAVSGRECVCACVHVCGCAYVEILQMHHMCLDICCICTISTYAHPPSERFWREAGCWLGVYTFINPCERVCGLGLSVGYDCFRRWNKFGY